MNSHFGQDETNLFWWLRWVGAFIGSLVVNAVFWTWLLFHQLKGAHEPAILILWASAVFGSWLLIVLPFMKRKEEVMGHVDEEDAVTLRWWLRWMALAVAFFLIACAVSTGLFIKFFGGVRGVPQAVGWFFLTLILWLPAAFFSIFMIRGKLNDAQRDRIRRVREGREQQVLS